MLDKDVLKALGRRLGSSLPLQPPNALPTDLARLVEELKAREQAGSLVKSTSRAACMIARNTEKPLPEMHVARLVG